MHSQTTTTSIFFLLLLLILTVTVTRAQLPYSFLEVCPHDSPTADNFIPILDQPCSQQYQISVAPLTRVNVTKLPVQGSCGTYYYMINVFGVSGYLSIQNACNAYGRLYRSGDAVKSCNSGGTSLYSNAALRGGKQAILGVGQVALVMSDPIYLADKNDYSYRVLVDQTSYYVYRGDICALSFAN